MRSQKNKTCSVVIAVYHRDTATELEPVIKSILTQTVKSDDIVIVCDGAVNDSIANLLTIYEKQKNVSIIRLDENVGAGAARNIGVAAAKNELVAISDSDDISLPNRFALQVKVFNKNPKLSVVGGLIEDSTTGKKRILPGGGTELRRFAAKRSPMNNPTIMVKKSDFLEVGGYDEKIRRGEDYILALKLLRARKQITNLQQVLVKYTVSDENIKRRKTWAATKDALSVAWRAFSYGIATPLDFGIAVLVRLGLFLLPDRLAEYLYSERLRG